MNKHKPESWYVNGDDVWIGDRNRRMVRQEPAIRRCDVLESACQAYGVAIDDCYEDRDGRFWAGNGEYESQVNYCPVCGTKAPKLIGERDEY